LFSLDAIEFKGYRNRSMSNAKSTAKPHTSSCYQRNDLREHQEQMEVTAKYTRFKKSASLPAYFLSQARLKKITQIYRTLSTDKLHLSAKSRPSPLPHPHPVPFTPLKLNSLDHSKPKPKLTLQRGDNSATQPQSSSLAWGQLACQLRALTGRFA
jgi:hypothetical protein